MELSMGTSLDDIRKKIAKGEIKTKVAKQLEKKNYFTVDRIQRKKRDPIQIINKVVSEPVVKVPQKPKSLSAVEIFAEAKESQDGGFGVKKKLFGLADKQLMVSGCCYTCFSVLLGFSYCRRH